MGGNPTERLRWKEAFHSLGVELEREFGLSPVSSKALLLRIGEFMDSCVPDMDGARLPGQISYTAVAAGEPAGKPIRYCLSVPVNLTMMHEGDAGVLYAEGAPALRRIRLSRLCKEAFRQDAALSHEDLSLILGVDRSTVRCYANACARKGEPPPTRGVVRDIGPGISHKRQVVALYYRGLLPGHIAARTGHQLGSVERYLADYSRVIHLHRGGLATGIIVRITALSPKTVQSYLDLFQEHDRAGRHAVTERLLSRFGPLEEPGGKEQDHG